jgi:hypothetical protein
MQILEMAFSNNNKNNFSSNNFARNVWVWSERGGGNGKLAVIGREVWNSLCYWSITNLLHGDVTMESRNSRTCKPADKKVLFKLYFQPATIRK